MYADDRTMAYRRINYRVCKVEHDLLFYRLTEMDFPFTIRRGFIVLFRSSAGFRHFREI